VQWSKVQSKNQFQIDISIKTLEYPVKFDVRKRNEKCMGLPKFYSFAAAGPKIKFVHTAMTDSATD